MKKSNTNMPRDAAALIPSTRNMVTKAAKTPNAAVYALKKWKLGLKLGAELTLSAKHAILVTQNVCISNFVNVNPTRRKKIVTKLAIILIRANKINCTSR